MTLRIEARSVARSFGPKAVLQDLSLTIEAGELIAVTGPSGCGKSTLLAILGALDRPGSGAVLWNDEDYGAAPERVRASLRKQIGFVFQQPHMLRGLPLWENVTAALVPRGVGDRERRRIGSELLEQVGVPGRETARPEQLSGGELQRVGVARALAGKPRLLLADEPTSDLDPETAASIAALFGAQKEAGTSVVIATHDPALIERATRQLPLRSPS